MAHFKNPDVWFWGLVAAFVGGGATSLTSWAGMAGAKQLGMDVPSLNLQALGVIFVSGAIWNTASYLKKSPVPELEDTTFISK